MAPDSKSATSTDNSSTATDPTSPRAGRPGVADPRRPTGRATEPADATAHETTEAVGEALRKGQDAVLRSVEMGTELMTRLSPLTLLAAGDQDETRYGEARPAVPAFPAAAWADGVFDLIETGLTAQRRYVDQLLAAQRNLVGRMLDTGTNIAAAQAELVRTGVATAEDTGSSRN